MHISVTHDKFLNGKVKITQPAQGYRAGMDAVFLAAAVPANTGEEILDVGAGVAVASLCLLNRVPGSRVVGFEMDPLFIELACFNGQQNQCQDSLRMLRGDLKEPPPRLAAGSFSHVMSNPPYFEQQTHSTRYTYSSKGTCHVHTTTTLQQWVDFCLLMVRPRGTVTFIHRADHLDTLLTLLTGKLGHLIIYPLWPHEHKAAHRIIIQGVKNSRTPLRLLRGMIVNDAEGKQSTEADRILREGQGLIFN